ncbi:MAG: NUDIX hydrolase [Patescibacteria group bacterium]
MNTIIKTTALIQDNKKILLIKEWSKKKNGYFWNVIRGTFDPEKDASLTAAIIREAKEEINLDIDVENILSIFEIKKLDSFLLQINFTGQPRLNSKPSLPKSFEQDEEIIEYKWFNFDEYKALKKEELMDKRVSIIINDFFLNKLKYPLQIIKGVD